MVKRFVYGVGAVVVIALFALHQTSFTVWLTACMLYGLSLLWRMASDKSVNWLEIIALIVLPIVPYAIEAAR